MSIGITDKIGRLKTLIFYALSLSIGNLILQISNTSNALLMAIILAILKFCAMAIYVPL